MTDIVERLRNSCSCNFPDTPCGAEDACRAAFDAAAEIERLRAALRGIAEHPTGGVGCNPEGFVRAARAALEEKHD